MAVCKYCKSEMLDYTSCLPEIVIGGVIYKRKRFNSPDDGYVGCDDSTTHCNDCACDTGGYHHFNCDNELCPACGNQMLIHIISGYLCPVAGEITHLVDENGNKIEIEKDVPQPMTLNEAKKIISKLQAKVESHRYNGGDNNE